MHILMRSGEKGLSKFMHSFKKNSTRDICTFLGKYDDKDRGDLRMRGDLRIAATGNNNDSKIDPENNKNCSCDSKIAVADIRWQKGYYDKHIENSTQRGHVVDYIHYNPYHHELVEDIANWPWTSLHMEKNLDPMEIWLD